MIDSLYEASYKILKNTLVLEMAIAKKEYSDKVFNIFHRVIEHYLLIKAHPDSTAATHWKNEIISFLSPIARSKYKHTKNYPKAKDFIQHVKDSGHEYDATGFNDIYNMMRVEKGIPHTDKAEFHKISVDFDKFLHHIATKIETGKLITIEDVH